MYKFFVSENQINGKEVKILGEDVNHIYNVLRLKIADKIIITSREIAKSYISEIISISKESVVCKILEKMNNTESLVNVDIYQGIPKFDKMEYIIQKSTEIGVKNIYPVNMNRCVVKLDSKTEAKKIDRWQKIAEASAKQSKRDYIPKIEKIINIENVCNNINKYDIILLAYENEKSNTLKKELQKLNKKEMLNIGVIIGPEGGISEREVERLISLGAKSVTLGNRILRTETASIVILSDIMYEFDL